MEVIKKKICIEDARTRTQGLMPFYELGSTYSPSLGECKTIAELGLTFSPFGNGNWGQIVANPCFLADTGKNYQTTFDSIVSFVL